MTTFGFNQPVTLKSDPTFLGYHWAQVSNDGDQEYVMVSVKNPGKTKFHLNAQIAIPVADIQPAEERQTRSRKSFWSAASKTTMLDQ